MRNGILILVLVGIFLGMGLIFCRVMGWEPRWREMMLAAGVCLGASGVGMLPLLLHRRVLSIHPAQAGFLATTLHLMLCSMVGGGAILLIQPPIAFTYWLLVFYWATLIGMCATAIGVVKTAGGT